MPFTVERVGNEPILLLALKEPLNLQEEIGGIFRTIDKHLSNMPTPAVVIHDFSEFHISFGDLVMGLQAQTKTPNAPGTLTDERSHTCIIGNDDIIRIASDSLKQDQYGGLDVPIYESYDEAIQYARQWLAQRS